jgi:hypothetical protein
MTVLTGEYVVAGFGPPWYPQANRMVVNVPFAKKDEEPANRMILRNVKALDTFWGALYDEPSLSAEKRHDQ